VMDLLSLFQGADRYQNVFHFDNNYGASVVMHDFSYGGKEGLFELAVIQYMDTGGWAITYDTHLTNDVIGWLDEAAVATHLLEIYELPPCELLVEQDYFREREERWDGLLDDSKVTEA